MHILQSKPQRIVIITFLSSVKRILQVQIVVSSFIRSALGNASYKSHLVHIDAEKINTIRFKFFVGLFLWGFFSSSLSSAYGPAR